MQVRVPSQRSSSSAVQSASLSQSQPPGGAFAQAGVAAIEHGTGRVVVAVRAVGDLFHDAEAGVATAGLSTGAGECRAVRVRRTLRGDGCVRGGVGAGSIVRIAVHDGVGSVARVVACRAVDRGCAVFRIGRCVGVGHHVGGIGRVVTAAARASEHAHHEQRRRQDAESGRSLLAEHSRPSAPVRAVAAGPACNLGTDHRKRPTPCSPPVFSARK